MTITALTGLESYELASIRGDAAQLIAKSRRDRVTIEATYSPRLAAALREQVYHDHGRVLGQYYESGEREHYSRLPMWTVQLVADNREVHS